MPQRCGISKTHELAKSNLMFCMYWLDKSNKKRNDSDAIKRKFLEQKCQFIQPFHAKGLGGIRLYNKS